jgi:hypothetical protein
MHPFNKPLKDLTPSDIDSLIKNGVPESRTLDYKRDLYSNNDAGKRDFLIDVSAFANTVGGYLIVGIEEQDGIPQVIPGIEIPSYDNLVQMYENLLKTSVDPAIRMVDFRVFDLQDSKKVLVIEVPRSISRPHVVTFLKHHRFYGRNSSGNYPFEVDDIRRAILESDTVAQRIRRFRMDRLSLIAAGETLIPSEVFGKIVLHIFPSSSFEVGQRYNLASSLTTSLQPMYCSGWDHRYTFDGFMTFSTFRNEHRARNYTQLFYNGIIEAVDTVILMPRNEKKGIPSVLFEESLVSSLRKYLSVLSSLEVDYPVWVCLSLLGVKEYMMFVSNYDFIDEIQPIDRDDLIIPEVQLDDASHSAEEILKPIFDSVWNACGYKQSVNYDEHGNWRLSKRK